MAWTANLDSVEKIAGNVVAHVSYTDGKEIITQDIPGDNLDAVSLAAFVGRKMASLVARDAAFATLVPGPITPIAPTTDAKAAALTTVATLKSYVDLGIMTATDPKFVNAQTAAKAVI